MAPNDRVLAVSFPDRADADAAAAILRADYAPRDGVHVADLGHATYPTPPGAVVAGRFQDAVVEAVRATVERLGGTVEIDAAEDELR